MPSSSEHETCQERRLCHWFKVTYARLYYARLHHEAAFVTTIFTELLECSKKDLLHSLQDDRKWWDTLVQQCKSKCDSNNVWAAADSMADAATCLFEFGRKMEGGRFCDWAEELKDRAIEIYEEEQEWQEEQKRRDSLVQDYSMR